MNYLRPRSTGSNSSVHPACALPGRGSSLGSLLLHPASPALIAFGLLSAGYAIAVALGEQAPFPPASLWQMAIISGAMFFLGHGKVFVLPKLPERAVTMLRWVSLLAVSLELAYFGVPLLGSVPYNEFGWPGVHHVAVMHWLLVLFGNKKKALDLSISLLISIMLFNRQMAMFAILAYVMTTPMSMKKMLTSSTVVACLILALGALRNHTLEVDTSGLEDTLELPLSGSLFFIYLYLTGPLYSGLTLSSDVWDTRLSVYWNTFPEWALFALQFGIPPVLSFALFYGLCALFAHVLRSSRSWELRCLGTLVHVYTFFSFFSNVVLSTPIIASFLIVVFAGSLFSSRKPR